MTENNTNPYVSYEFEIKPKGAMTFQVGCDILIAELGYVGFESFVENETGVTAFIQEPDWNEAILSPVELLHSSEYDISFKKEIIAQVNWNAEWEKNFNPIIVDGMCTVRAPFHEVPGTTYDIIIEPKMSFGTGHHETTHMMIQHLLRLSLDGKDVLDMGCGTGVLAILASLKGAASLDAIDIDEWCYLNTKENIERNKCTNINVFQGDASVLGERSYDLIIANINRNILLNDIPTYISILNKGGVLLLSGFYEVDLDLISQCCITHGLEFTLKLNRNNWIAVHYDKK